jgi:hypothetical protein
MGAASDSKNEFLSDSNPGTLSGPRDFQLPMESVYLLKFVINCSTALKRQPKHYDRG